MDAPTVDSADVVARALAEDLGDGDVTTAATVPADSAGQRGHPPEGARCHLRPRRGRAGVPLARIPRRRSPARWPRACGARAARCCASKGARAGAAVRRAHRAELPAAPLGRGHDGGASRPGHRWAPARGSSTRARRRRGCGRWRRPRSPPAGRPTTAPASTTRSSSRRTTPRSPAESGRLCAGPASRRPDLPLEVECRDLAEVDEALAAGAPSAAPGQHEPRSAARGRGARRRAAPSSRPAAA